MVTKKTGAAKGRRKKVYKTDPDRFAIALATALISRGVSEATAFLVAASLFYGKEVSPEKTRRHQPPDSEAISWVSGTYPGAVSLPNKATTLRLKFHRGLSPEDGAHHTVLATSCALALGATNVAVAADLLVDLLAPIGEIAFATDVLIPVVLAKASCPL